MPRRHHRLSSRLRRTWSGIAPAKRASIIVVLVLVIVLLLMLVWERLTGEWIVDTIMARFGR